MWKEKCLKNLESQFNNQLNVMELVDKIGLISKQAKDCRHLKT